MRIAAMLIGLTFCGGVVLDAFQTIILPRRPTGRLRITRLFYIVTWTPWVWVAERIENRKVREQMYSVFGPLSLLLLIVLWAILLVIGFALLLFAIRSPFVDSSLPMGAGNFGHFLTDLYVSGTTLTTVGPGDVVSRNVWARALVVIESGTGLGFVALVISYLPVLYGAFSRREVSVALLDGRAGSPPTAAELLRRHGFDGGQEALSSLLEEWERWSADILESHISYPLLCYYRSQHDNQSWLSALVSVLDACALLITTIEGPASRQAQLTFAMARHALIDLGHVFHLEEREAVWLERARLERLPAEIFDRLCEALGPIEMRLCGDPASMERLTTIRALYEPHAMALSHYLKMPLPQWVAEPRKKDYWRTVANLRSQAAAVWGERVSHVSEQAGSADLHGDGHGF